MKFLGTWYNCLIESISWADFSWYPPFASLIDSLSLAKNGGSVCISACSTWVTLQLTVAHMTHLSSWDSWCDSISPVTSGLLHRILPCFTVFYDKSFLCSLVSAPFWVFLYVSCDFWVLCSSPHLLLEEHEHVVPSVFVLFGWLFISLYCLAAKWPKLYEQLSLGEGEWLWKAAICSLKLPSACHFPYCYFFFCFSFGFHCLLMVARLISASYSCSSLRAGPTR